MKKLLFISIVAIICCDGFSQSPLVKKWDYRFGGTDRDALQYIQQTNDSGFILGGWTYSDSTGDMSQHSRGETDYWIVKTDSLGAKQLDKRFGGGSWDILRSLQQTSDGGYILGGDTYSDSTGNMSQHTRGLEDYWMVKIDAFGIKQWDKRFGGSGSDQLFSILQTSDGGYILGGYTESDQTGDMSQHSRGFEDYWIVKTDEFGIKQWDKRFGGKDPDYLYSLQQTSDGGYILGGWSDSDSSGDVSQHTRGGYDYWVVKTDASGNKLWDKRFGGGDVGGRPF